ncbi:MAG: AAA family ATPase [Acidovorax sp.]|uniref:AAA family ATPase n=1 Tax=Acidovorax sp. TaxID=1872122 RepID=UPI0022C5005D|nr:AAA family ATPase [Acidovorax sp.]MCZ8222047.1 AAA family ATPase [Acidovorax sp.]
MNIEIQARPELLHGPNPFIERVPGLIPFSDLPRRLNKSYSVDWQSIPPAYREPLLDDMSQRFVSTAQVLEPAAGIQKLFRQALASNNPVRKEEQRRVNQVGVSLSVESIKKTQSMNGGGMILKGMTGSGKTALIERTLEIIAPHQVIDHEDCEAWGMYGLKQCVYLRIDHASNGTRGGLLKRILHGLDEALGTGYFQQHQRTGNIDSLLVVVCKLLVHHRVALLCIDEKQQSNFQDSPWALEFVLFYMQLMNLGVSVVLAGNPLAFEQLESSSQVMRRFSVGGDHALKPATSVIEPWWARDFVPMARQFSVVESWAIDPELRSQLEFRYSGGLVGLFAVLHIEAQRSALRRAKSSATVTEEDYSVAIDSPQFRNLKKIAEAIRLEGPANNHFVDIPDNVAAPKVKMPPEASKENFSGLSKSQVNVLGRHLKNYKSQVTRNANKLQAKLEQIKNLSEDDIRMLGITKSHIESMYETLEAQKKNLKK